MLPLTFESEGQEKVEQKSAISGWNAKINPNCHSGVERNLRTLLSSTCTSCSSERLANVWLRRRQQVAFKCLSFFFFLNETITCFLQRYIRNQTLSPRKKRESKRHKEAGLARSPPLCLRTPPHHSLFGRTRTHNLPVILK